MYVWSVVRSSFLEATCGLFLNHTLFIVVIGWLLFLDKFRVQKDKSFVHYLQAASNTFVIVLEFSQNFLRSFFWQFNQQTLWRFHIVGRNEQMRVVGADLDHKVAVSELFWPLVKNNTVLIEIFSLPDQGLISLSQGLRRIDATRGPRRKLLHALSANGTVLCQPALII